MKKLINDLYKTIDHNELIINDLIEKNKQLQKELKQALKAYNRELQNNNKAIEYVMRRMIVEQAFSLDMKQCYELLQNLKGEEYYE